MAGPGLFKRDDALGGLTETEGSLVTGRVDEDGAVWVHPTGTAAGAGAVGATVQRVTLASDDPQVTLATALNSKLDTVITLLGTSLATQVWKPVGPYTTTQTGTILWTPASGKKVAITHIFLTSSGTDVGLARLWLGAAGDTTYTAGTDQLVIVMNFGPNATADAESFPGMPLSLASPIIATTADHKLMIDTTNNLDIDGVIYGYEIS